MGRKRARSAVRGIRPLTWIDVVAMVVCVGTVTVIYLLAGPAAVTVVITAGPALYWALRRRRRQ